MVRKLLLKFLSACGFVLSVVIFTGIVWLAWIEKTGDIMASHHPTQPLPPRRAFEDGIKLYPSPPSRHEYHAPGEGCRDGLFC